MSIQVTMYARERRLSWREWLAGHLATAAARVLARLRPRRLRQMLTLIQKGARPAPYGQALMAQQTVVTASAHCAGIRQCLTRSIATCLFCRLHGAWPAWCMGVRTAPFRAHAWVEADGQPVGEVPGFGGYQLLMSVPACTPAHPASPGHPVPPANEEG